MNILVVDDDRLSCLSMAQILRDAGHDVLAFESAQEALGRVETAPVDAAIVDYRMPGMDGLAFLRHARAMRPALPVILMSAHWTPRRLEEARRLDATACLTKPFDMDGLLAILAQIAL